MHCSKCHGKLFKGKNGIVHKYCYFPTANHGEVETELQEKVDKLKRELQDAERTLYDVVKERHLLAEGKQCEHFKALEELKYVVDNDNKHQKQYNAGRNHMIDLILKNSNFCHVCGVPRLHKEINENRSLYGCDLT